MHWISHQNLKYRQLLCIDQSLFKYLKRQKCYLPWFHHWTLTMCWGITPSSIFIYNKTLINRYMSQYSVYVLLQRKFTILDSAQEPDVYLDIPLLKMSSQRLMRGTLKSGLISSMISLTKFLSSVTPPHF